MLKLRCPQPPDKVVRELNPAAWFRADTGVTVTGLGVSTWADQSGNGRDLLQSTDASRPPYLSYTGTKYLYLPGVTGNNATTPDTAGNSFSGDVDLMVRVSLDDWTPSATQTFLAKWLSGNRGYVFQINTTGNLIFAYSADGFAVRVGTASAATSITDGSASWVRATYAIATGKVNFYKAADSDSVPSSWTAIGTEQTITSGAIFNSNQTIMVGQSQDTGSELPAAGKIYRALGYSTIGGSTPAFDFNPSDTSDASTSFASSATGETWTVNSSGGLPAQIVGSPRLLADGTADAMATANFTLNQACSGIMVVNALSWTAGDYLLSGTVAEAGLTQVTATPQVGLNAGAAAAANGGLTLGAWKVIYYEFNGASSKLKVGSAAATTGNAGANNPGGLALFRNQAATAFGNAMLREWIVFSAALDDAAIARAMQYASGRWGVAL